MSLLNTPPPFISSIDLLATDRALLSLAPELMPTTRAIRAVGFVHLPGSTEALHYPIVVPLVNAKQVTNVFRRAFAHSPDESAVISRLIQEWSRICEELEARDQAAEDSHSEGHGVPASGES